MPRNANKDKLSNYSIEFNSSNTESITTSDNIGISGSQSRTMSVWLKGGSTNNGKNWPMAVAFGSGNTNRAMWIGGGGSPSAYWYFGFWGSPSATSGDLASTVRMDADDNWHLLTSVYDESTQTAKGYIDGVEVVSGSRPSINTGSSPLIIGKHLTESTYWDGPIAQVSIFDYALSTDQINYLYNLNNPMAITGAEPIAYWPLGDNSNPNAPGSFPNISVGADSVFDFDNGDKIITIALSNFVTNNITVSLWVNYATLPSSYAGNPMGATNGGGWDSGFGFVNTGSSGNLRFFIENWDNSPAGTGGFVDNTTTLTTNTWFHLVGTWDGSTVSYYINSVLQGTASYTGTLTTSDIVAIGTNFADVGYNINAMISNAQIWNTALLSSEVITLYNNGQPLMTGTQPQAANLKAWYKLNQSANWEADTAGNWQIPDAVSSYPQSFDFIPNNLILFSKSDSYKLQEFSVSLWFKPDVNSSDPIFLNGAYGLGSQGFEIFQYFSGIRVRINSSNQVIGGLTIGKWHHIFVSYDGTTMKYSVNGEAIQTGTLTGGAVNYSSYSGIAVGRSVYGYTDGKISNVMVWNSDISASSNLTYNNGVPLTTAIAADNLKGWWKLDNTELFDGNHWSLNNQKYPANYTSALYFTGGAGNEHLETDSNSDLLMAGSHTFSLWLYINFNQIDSTNYIFNKSGLDYALGFDGNKLRLIYYNYYDSGGASGKNKIIVLNSDWKTPNKKAWHHIFVSVDQPNLTVTLITDGTDISTHALPADYVSPDQGGGVLNIMSYTGTTFSLAGFISNLAFFNGTALSNSQALTLYNNGTPENNISFSPTSWWKIDNTSTGLLDNAGSANLTNTGGVEKNIFVSAEAGVSSGMTEQNLVNNNVSVLNGESSGMDTTNLVQSNLTRTQPFSNYSFNFDVASSDYIDCGTSSDLEITGNLTLSAWIYLQSGSAYQGIISKRDSGGTNYQLYTDNSVTPKLRFFDGSTATSSTGTVSLNAWHHVGITVNSGVTNGSIFYIDGVNSGTATFTITSNDANLLLGTIFQGSLGSFFNGKISNISLFDNELTQDDIINLYNNGILQDLSNFRITPIAWWPMDEHSSYYDGTDWVVRDLINGNDGQGANTGNVDDLVGNAPGSEASGTGSNLTITDLKGNMSSSDKNAYSINMADYADGVINPANSGRSTDVP